MLKIAGMIAIMAAGFPSNAHAYLDPGTGSILLQVLSVGFLSALAFWQKGVTYIRAYFAKKQIEKTKGTEE